MAMSAADPPVSYAGHEKHSTQRARLSEVSGLLQNKAFITCDDFELLPVYQVDDCRFFPGELPGGRKFSPHL